MATSTSPSTQTHDQEQFLSDAITMDINEEQKEEEAEEQENIRKPTATAIVVDSDDNDEEDYQINKKPTKYGLIEPNDGSEDIDSLPYKNTAYYKFKYRIESFFVIHPRFNALYLLYRSIWPRALVIVDMYTDILVASTLYTSTHTFWFMLSCLFVALPFVLVWSVSLRFIQMYLTKLFQRLNTKKSKRPSQTLFGKILHKKKMSKKKIETS